MPFSNVDYIFSFKVGMQDGILDLIILFAVASMPNTLYQAEYGVLIKFA